MRAVGWTGEQVDERTEKLLQPPLCTSRVCPSAAAGTLGEAEGRPWVLTRLTGTRHRQVADPYSAVLDSALR